MSRRVAIVGAGITGLAAAFDLAESCEVSLFESAERVGGKIATSTIAGRPVDEGPDAFLARVPWATALCRELGLGDRLISPTGKGAFVWARGKLRPIPESMVLGVPTELRALARSGVLGARAMARAGLEPLMPRRDPHDSVGALVRSRFGDGVADYLVDPLLGGIYAGNADGMSIEATTPQLTSASTARSMLLALRAQQRQQAAAATGAPAPVFHSIDGGLTVLVDTLAERLDGRVDLRRSSPVHELTPDAVVNGESFDSVIVCTPAPVTARLIAPWAGEAGSELLSIPMASVVLVTLAVPEDGFTRSLEATGFLVPRPERRHLTACSWFTSKWGQYAGGGSVVLRASLGAIDAPGACDLSDDVIVQRTLDDLHQMMGLRADPSEVRINRWPDSFPQYLPGHLGRVARIESELGAATDRVRVAGAAYRGIGIPACIRQGREAAAAVLSGIGA